MQGLAWHLIGPAPSFCSDIDPVLASILVLTQPTGPESRGWWLCHSDGRITNVQGWMIRVVAN
jgi:hypothetical protein